MITITIRAPDPLVAELDRLVAEERRSHPGWRVSRESLARELLHALLSQPAMARRLRATARQLPDAARLIHSDAE